ncbi:MAG: hypothetical protein HRU70_10600 [Phycisphaeraceae bacterium]|nr:MAG: hypothetical protein HRU70_10600 [Phycisphaeraceae bacterium]
MTKLAPKTTPPQPTAAEVYATRRNDVARLLDVLRMHLDINDKEHTADPANWGLVGNLGKVREDLVSLVGFMANMDPEHVEEFLKGG